MVGKYKVITLCGSNRSEIEYAEDYGKKAGYQMLVCLTPVRKNGWHYLSFVAAEYLKSLAVLRPDAQWGTLS